MTIGRTVQMEWLLVFVVAVGGCGSSQGPANSPSTPGTPSTSNASSASGTSSAPNVIDTSRLAELGDPMPPLDDGRIEAAPPKGWDVPPRSSKYLARFQQKTDSPYPTIIITAEDYAGLANVSRENVAQFAADLAAEMKKPLDAVKPIEVGPFLGVVYRKRGLEPGSLNKILEEMFLDTVVAGRKYSIMLVTREGSLDEGESYLMAVARGMKFLKAASPEAVTVAASEKPAVPEAKPEAGKTEPQPAAGGAKEEAKPPEKPKKDDLDLDNLNLDELLK